MHSLGDPVVAVGRGRVQGRPAVFVLRDVFFLNLFTIICFSYLFFLIKEKILLTLFQINRVLSTFCTFSTLCALTCKLTAAPCLRRSCTTTWLLSSTAWGIKLRWGLKRWHQGHSAREDHHHKTVTGQEENRRGKQ